MSEIVFSSVLDGSYYEDLRKLLFFNPNQERVASHILEAVERYGTPKISKKGDELRVELGSSAGAQCLFVLDSHEPDARLLGVVVYTREGSTLVVVHVAVDEDYSNRGVNADQMLFVRIIAGLRDVARRIKGVDSLTVFAGSAGAKRIRVR
jgi:hypothetical protein